MGEERELGCRRLGEPATKERRPEDPLTPLQGPTLQVAAGRGALSATVTGQLMQVM